MRVRAAPTGAAVRQLEFATAEGAVAPGERDELLHALLRDLGEAATNARISQVRVAADTYFRAAPG